MLVGTGWASLINWIFRAAIAFDVVRWPRALGNATQLSDLDFLAWPLVVILASPVPCVNQSSVHCNNTKSTSRTDHRVC